jgi:tight adherence protein C
MIDAALDDPSVLVGTFATLGLAALALAAMGFAQGRREVRRRAATGLGEAGGSVKGPTRAEAQASLERLMTYLNTTFSGGDEKQNRLLRLKLVQAGFYDQRAVAAFFAARLASLAVLGLGALAFLPFLVGELSRTNLWLGAAFVGIAGYFAPGIYLNRRITSRTRQHRLGFPDFMDLMVVCSEAGLSMEAAIDRIARELVETHPSLAENLYMVSLEMRAGKGFGEALERLGRRLGIEEASMLASLLQQSAELGTSLSQSLRVYSEEMRHKRLSRAEEKAYALPAKLVVPLTLFVFPTLLIVLMAPVVIRFSSVKLG